MCSTLCEIGILAAAPEMSYVTLSFGRPALDSRELDYWNKDACHKTLLATYILYTYNRYLSTCSSELESTCAVVVHTTKEARTKPIRLSAG